MAPWRSSRRRVGVPKNGTLQRCAVERAHAGVVTEIVRAKGTNKLRRRGERETSSATVEAMAVRRGRSLMRLVFLLVT